MIRSVHRYMYQRTFKLSLLVWDNCLEGFPGGSVVKKSACSTGDMGSAPGSGRSPEEENGNLPQYSCLGNPMEREAWQATVMGLQKRLI